MIEVHAQDTVVFANGWKVATVTKPGVIRVASKMGPETVDQPFNVGDVVLAGADGHIIVAPLSFAGATEIARKVIEGDPRACSDSHSLRALAAAVIGFAVQTVAPEPTRDPPPASSDALATPAEPQPEGISA